MAVKVLLLDKERRIFQVLADMFNVTTHRLLIALDEDKAKELIEIAQPDILLLRDKDLPFWLTLVKEGMLILPIFLVESYDDADKIKELGFRDINVVVLPFNPLEFLSQIGILGKDTIEPYHLSLLGPLNLLLKFITKKLSGCILLEGMERCTVEVKEGVLRGTSCDVETLKKLLREESVEVRIESSTGTELSHYFKGNSDLILLLTEETPEVTPAVVKLQVEEEDLAQPVELEENLLWVGTVDTYGLLHRNVYLRIYERNGVRLPILIGSCSPQEYPHVRSKVEQVVGTLDALKAFVVLGASVEELSGVVNFLQSSTRLSIITSSHLARVLNSMGVPYARVRTVESFHKGKLRLATGHTITFIPAPFMPLKGSLALYEEDTKILFSPAFLSSLTLPKEFSPKGDAKYEDLYLFYSLYICSHHTFENFIQRLYPLDPVKVLPAFGNPVQRDPIRMAEDLLRHKLPTNVYQEDVAEFLQSLTELLKERMAPEEYQVFVDELSQYPLSPEGLLYSLIKVRAHPSHLKYVLEEMLKLGILPSTI